MPGLSRASSLGVEVSVLSTEASDHYAVTYEMLCRAERGSSVGPEDGSFTVASGISRKWSANSVEAAALTQPRRTPLSKARAAHGSLMDTMC